jgi:hypothetical protein
MRHSDAWVSVDTPAHGPHRCSSSALSRSVFGVGGARGEGGELRLVDVPLISPPTARIVDAATSTDEAQALELRDSALDCRARAARHVPQDGVRDSAAAQGARPQAHRDDGAQHVAQRPRQALGRVGGI